MNQEGQAWEMIVKCVEKKSTVCATRMRQEGYQSATRLRLSSYQLSGQGAQYLGNTNFPKALLMILYSNNLTATDMKNIMTARWPLLLQLDLSQNNIGDEGVSYLVRMSLPNLQSVNLRENGISDKGALYFCQANWPRLVELMLSKNQIQAEGIKNLTKICCPLIFILVLKAHNKLQDDGLQYLAQSQWKDMKRLYLDSCGISYSGYQHFKSSNWTKLRHLSLTNNRINSGSLRLMLRNNWDQLEQISLNCTPQSNLTTFEQSGCLILSKCYWPNLNIINLNFVSPGKNLLQMVAYANWVHLKRILFYGDEIEGIHLTSLCLSNWQQVVEMNLGGNLIGKVAGILSGIMGKFPKLTSLYLKNSNIPEQLQQKIQQNLQN